MFAVTTVHLSSDTAAAGVDFGQTELGELSAAELLALLARFRQLDALQNADIDPHLLITARAGRFLIRTGQGKLFLYNARDTTEPYAELTPEEILAHLDHTPAAAAAESDVSSVPPPAPHRGIAFGIFIAGLALNGYTLYSAFYSESVNEKNAITLLTEADELTAHQRSVIGTYATGGQPGDRVITVGADGRVIFAEVSAATSLNNGTDTYRLGRHEKKGRAPSTSSDKGKLCLTTTDSGVIDILNIDTLVYYRDTYKRR